MSFWDWFIVLAGLAGLVLLAYSTQKLNKGVAFFLAANRCAGRYLLTLSEGMGHMSAAGLIAMFEMWYKSGFVVGYWSMFTGAVMTVAPLSGFMIYRYRQTRCLTMAQFCERRYSRRLRIFVGILSFAGGVLNFTLVPAISARFLVTYCSIPGGFTLGGVTFSSFALVLAVMMTVAVIFTLWGGQITVLVTDTVQGIVAGAVCCILAIYLLAIIDWPVLMRSLASMPAGYSYVDPFDAGKVENFNLGFVILSLFSFFYYFLGNPGIQANRSAAINAHESRMAGILAGYRLQGFGAFGILAAIFAYVYLHEPEYASIAREMNIQLDAIPNAIDRFQAITPLFMQHVLPVGLMGGFVLMMVMSYISTDDTYLQGWASVFLQDIVLPLRGKPLSPERHMFWLRITVIILALCVYFGALAFEQAQHITMFWMITGAIYGAGGGIIMIGGLYWKHAKTSGAWAAMIVGAICAVSGLICIQCLPGFPLDGTWCFFYSALAAIAAFVIVSLLDRSPACDMDKLLYRGRYAVEGDHAERPDGGVSRLQQLIGITPEFSRSDRFLYGFTLVYSILVLPSFALILAVGHSMGWLGKWEWSRIWMYYSIYTVIFASFCALWMAVGGSRDICRLYRRLHREKDNPEDDGTVLEHLGDEKSDRRETAN